MRKPLFVIFALLLLTGLAGCGKRGPLYWVDPNAAPAQDNKSERKPESPPAK